METVNADVCQDDISKEVLIQDRLFDINFFSVIQLIQKALPYLRESKGSIVMLSSGAANIYVKGWDAYGS